MKVEAWPAYGFRGDFLVRQRVLGHRVQALLTPFAVPWARRSVTERYMAPSAKACTMAPICQRPELCRLLTPAT